MDWNSVMPFIGFGGIVVICSLCFRVGKFYGDVMCLKEKVYHNEDKSIDSTNIQTNKIDEILSKVTNTDNKLGNVENQLTNIKETLDSHEKRLGDLERYST